jgi:hypothetical protein
MADILNSNYSKSLAKHLFNKLNEYQSSEWVRRYVPRLSGSGLYVSERKIEEWIKEHDIEE